MNEDELLARTAAEIAGKCQGDTHDSCWKALTDTGFSALRDVGDGGDPMATVTQTALVVTELSKVVCGAPLIGSLLAAEALRLADAEVDEPATVVLGSGLGSLGGSVGWDTASLTHAVTLDNAELALVKLGDPVEAGDFTRGVAERGDLVRGLGAGLRESQLRHWQDFARLLVTADLLGAAEGLFTQAVEYAKQRVQFGRAIGSFQAVQHILARAFTELEAIRSTLAHAAHAIDTGEDPHTAAAVAKAYASEAAVSVVEASIQVFGGVAITWEFPAHLHLRRVVADAALFGTADDLYGLLHDELEGAGR
ncbi:acyl-CoA dehydrogenase family protein [Amycolatopsis acidicola]|nr:acyl-CoA dehydrogenase family protein [Amycolatopsis acidicola]